MCSNIEYVLKGSLIHTYSWVWACGYSFTQSQIFVCILKHLMELISDVEWTISFSTSNFIRILWIFRSSSHTFILISLQLSNNFNLVKTKIFLFSFLHLINTVVQYSIKPTGIDYEVIRILKCFSRIPNFKIYFLRVFAE